MRAAAIDIGTNSCRLLVVEENKEKSCSVLESKLKITRLGEAVDEDRKLKESAVERVLNALKLYKKILEQYQVRKVRVVGTSALRDVKNSDLLADKINDLELELEIISGEEEARLNYLGAASNLGSNFLLIDIGGGSTEFIWSHKSNIKFRSLDLGCVRMTEKFISNPKSAISLSEIDKIKSYVKEKLMSNLKLKKDFKLKGLGGTITTLAAIKLKLEVYDSSKIENLKITKTELEAIFNNLSGLELDKRKEVNGLQPKRADIIVAGLIILNCILEYTNSQQIYASNHDLLYGLVKEELAKK